MTAETDLSFSDVVETYRHLEAPGQDAWNPLGNPTELWHRVRLLVAMARALELMEVPLAEAKILDVGCGVGRSTRALLEFGARPEKILGLDLRPEAVTFARQVNPALNFQAVREFRDWPLPASFDLCLQCTTFSSIEGRDRRLALAVMMEKMVIPGGYIFWWDLIRANVFAGSDRLEPRSLFRNCELIDHRTYRRRPTLADVLIFSRVWTNLLGNQERGSFLAKVVSRLSFFPPQHCAGLFRKRR